MPYGKVVGVKPYSFTDEVSKKVVVGTKFYVASKITSEGGAGIEVEYFNLSKERFSKVCKDIDDVMELLDAEIYFGKNTAGAVDKIEVE